MSNFEKPHQKHSGYRGNNRGRRHRRGGWRQSYQRDSDKDTLSDPTMRSTQVGYNTNYTSYVRKPSRTERFSIGNKIFSISTFISPKPIQATDDKQGKGIRDVLLHLGTCIYVGQHANDIGYPYKKDYWTLVVSVDCLEDSDYNINIHNDTEEMISVIAGHQWNGKDGNVSGFFWGGELYWVLGQRGVHIVLRHDFPEEDFATYRDVVYSNVLEFGLLCKSFFEKQKLLCEDRKLYLKNFHHVIAEQGWTCYAERVVCNDPLFQGGNGVDELRFYAIMQNNALDKNGNVKSTSRKQLCVDVKHAEAFLKEIALTFSQRKAQAPKKTPECSALPDDTHHSANSSGCVVDTDQSDAIHLWKKDYHLYSLELAAQKAIVTDNFTGDILESYLLKIISAYERKHCMNVFQWKNERLPWIIDFAEWLHATKRLNPPMQHDMPSDPHSWHLLQEEFTESLSDKAELEKFSEYCEKNLPKATKIEGKADLIQLDEVPGSDKMILSETLFALLKQSFFKPLLLEKNYLHDADDCPTRVTNVMCNMSETTHLILYGLNVGKYPSTRSKKFRPTVAVMWSHVDDNSRMRAVCSEGIVNQSETPNKFVLQESSPSFNKKAVEIDKASGTPSASAFKCQELSADHVVILNKTLTLTQMIQKVWHCLKESGKHKLPNLETLDVKAAEDIARMYEIVRHSYCTRDIPIYASIEILSPCSRLLRHIPRRFLANKNVQDSFHVTTKYFGGARDDFMLAQLLVLHERAIELTLLWVVSDSKATAIVVRNENSSEFPCANRFAHITIANRYDVPPVYSNELCHKASLGMRGGKNDICIVKLPPKTTVDGVFSFYYR